MLPTATYNDSPVLIRALQSRLNIQEIAMPSAAPAAAPAAASEDAPLEVCHTLLLPTSPY
jgi:hypothetical protein